MRVNFLAMLYALEFLLIMRIYVFISNKKYLQTKGLFYLSNDLLRTVVNNYRLFVNKFSVVELLYRLNLETSYLMRNPN